MDAASGFTGLMKAVRWLGGRRRPAILQPVTLDGRPLDLRFEASPLGEGDASGWPFEVADSQHLYVVQPGNGRKFRTDPPHTTVGVPEACRLILHSRMKRPLPRGCQLWAFAYREGGFIGRAVLNLWEPVARSILDVPSGDIQLCFALRLASHGLYRPSDLELSIEAGAFPPALPPTYAKDLARPDRDATLDLAEAARRSGDLDAAERLLRDGFGDPAASPASARLFARLAGAGAAEVARERCRTAWLLGGEEADLRHHVEACLRAGRAEEALNALGEPDAVAGVWPSERLRLLARVLGEVGRHGAAIPVWTAILGQYDTARNVPPEVLKLESVARTALAESGGADAPLPAGRRYPSGPVVRDAEAYDGLGLTAQARLRLEAEARHGADPVNALWALVRLEARAERPERALEHLDALKRLGAAAPDGDWLEPLLLMRTEQVEAARIATDRALAANPSDTLFAMAANLSPTATGRIDYLNRILHGHGLSPVRFRDLDAASGMDALTTSAPDRIDGPLVTVIVPVFNAADTLATSLTSLADQTWSRLEILIVDDCSTDGSIGVACAFAAADRRFRLIVNAENRGPYYCRNAGLSQARGDYVTCQDADDWSHPERIQRQVQHLLDAPGLIANLSRCVTVTPDLTFTPRSATISPFRWNLSSLMFRRAEVIARAGYWEEVRFAGDGEFIARLDAAFGPGAVGYLAAGPLAVIRQTPDSLTAVGGGLTQLGHTSRLEYRERYLTHLKARPVERVEPHAPLRPLAAPPAMTAAEGAATHFDVIVASDFCLAGGSTASSIQEILAQRAAGLKTGLVQMYGYRNSVHRTISPKVRALIDDDRVQLITSDQAATARVLIIRWPPVLAGVNLGLAAVRADHVVIVANQTPLRSDAPDADVVYDPVVCDGIARETFGKRPVWAPIGPVVRAALAPFADVIDVADDDWINVIDAGRWNNGSRLRQAGAKPVIGRHARDAAGKWPDDPADLLAAYPEDGSLDVRILGGAEIARGVLGRIPSAWTVYGFDATTPAEFLQTLDYFVYFPDPTLNEAFGRTIVEAMAAGVPVILPSRFEPVFGDAALYGAPRDVAGLIRTLDADPAARDARIAAGAAFVTRHGYPVHHARLAALGVTFPHGA